MVFPHFKRKQLRSINFGLVQCDGLVFAKGCISRIYDQWVHCLPLIIHLKHLVQESRDEGDFLFVHFGSEFSYLCRYTTSGDSSHFFVYLTKRVFSQLGEIKILLESSSSNLRETRNPKLDTGPRDSGTGLVMIKGR
jgi:hypothetical protein